jgi:diguanylate cyclase (GGDEF)-like protein
MLKMFNIMKVSKEHSDEFRDRLISENSKRFFLLLVFVAFSQILFVLLELLNILKWNNATFISRIAVFCVCSAFAGLIHAFGKKRENKRAILVQGLLISSIQLLSISAGCYFVIIMFDSGVFSYSAFSLVAFIVSLTCARTPYYSGFVVFVFFIGLTIYLGAYNTPVSSWAGEMIIALVFIVLLYIGNIFTYNRHIKLFLQEIEMSEMNFKLKTMSQTDELTGIYNRRKMSEVIDENIALSKRYMTCFCIAILDIDHFKEVNDHYGHNAGDIVLRQLSTNIRSLLRSTDVFGRWGGEEFLILVPHCQEPDAFLLIERLRKSIEKYEFPEAGKITFSAGISSYKAGDGFSKLTEEADLALYEAKLAGRNQTAIFRLNVA